MGFGDDIQKFALKTGLRTSVVVRKLALDIYTDVVKRSPVDTGRFRGSWRIGVDKADLSVAKHGTPLGAKGGEHQGTPGRGVPPTPKQLSKATTAVASASGTKNVRIIVSNNLPYASLLERGSSKQAPEGVAAGALHNAITGFHQTVTSLGGS